MRISLPALLISVAFLAGCSTKANPFNWFGNDDERVTAEAPQSTNPLIPERSGIFSGRDREFVYPGAPVETITGVTVERVPGGILIRATGVAAVQGLYDVRLIPVTEDETAVDGVLSYTLEGVRPRSVRTGPVATREVIVARKVTDQTLEGTRTIRVAGITNAMTARR